MRMNLRTADIAAERSFNDENYLPLAEKPSFVDAPKIFDTVHKW